MKQGTLYVTLEIHFTYDEKRTSFEDAVYFAKDLAIDPCYDSIVNGVSLTAVRIENEEGFKY